jgi:hypothetical protein
MFSGWRLLDGAHRIHQIRFQSPMLLQVEPLLPSIQLILVHRSEIGFLSHCLPSPFSVTEVNGPPVEFVPWSSQKDATKGVISRFSSPPRCLAGSTVRPVSIRRHCDSAIPPHCRPVRNRPPLLNHKRFIGFNFSPDRHLGKPLRNAP